MMLALCRGELLLGVELELFLMMMMIIIILMLLLLLLLLLLLHFLVVVDIAIVVFVRVFFAPVLQSSACSGEETGELAASSPIDRQ